MRLMAGRLGDDSRPRSRPVLSVFFVVLLLAACVSPQMHSTLQHASIRLFVQIWDSRDGTIAWEGVQELNYAYDAASEKEVAFKTVVEEMARNVIAHLP